MWQMIRVKKQSLLIRKEKSRQKPAFFLGLKDWSGRCDSGNRAGIHTCAAINAGFCVNSPLLSRFAYGVGRAGIITCAAIDAFVGNYVSQDITSFKFFYRVTDYFYTLFSSYHMRPEKSSRKKGVRFTNPLIASE